MYKEKKKTPIIIMTYTRTELYTHTCDGVKFLRTMDFFNYLGRRLFYGYDDFRDDYETYTIYNRTLKKRKHNHRNNKKYDYTVPAYDIKKKLYEV
jgi:hypothetical protein